MLPHKINYEPIKSDFSLEKLLTSIEKLSKDNWYYVLSAPRFSAGIMKINNDKVFKFSSPVGWAELTDDTLDDPELEKAIKYIVTWNPKFLPKELQGDHYIIHEPEPPSEIMKIGKQLFTRSKNGYEGCTVWYPMLYDPRKGLLRITANLEEYDVPVEILPEDIDLTIKAEVTKPLFPYIEPDRIKSLHYAGENKYELQYISSNKSIVTDVEFTDDYVIFKHVPFKNGMFEVALPVGYRGSDPLEKEAVDEVMSAGAFAKPVDTSVKIGSSRTVDRLYAYHDEIFGVKFCRYIAVKHDNDYYFIEAETITAELLSRLPSTIKRCIERPEDDECNNYKVKKVDKAMFNKVLNTNEFTKLRFLFESEFLKEPVLH